MTMQWHDNIDNIVNIISRQYKHIFCLHRNHQPDFLLFLSEAFLEDFSGKTQQNVPYLISTSI